MEDPVEEWEIEEYYNYSGEDECKSKVSWILNRGLQLGKTAVITGFVMSSAPLVLPPLVVVSAVGFAVSVPFGVAFASYACTQKLMSKLLPIPPPSSTLEFDNGLVDEEEEKLELARMEEEAEKQFEEDKHENLNKDESIKEKGYEDVVGDEGSLGGTNIKIEGVQKEVEKEQLIEEAKNERPSPEVRRVVVVMGGEKENANDVTKTDELVVVARGVCSDIRDVEKATSNEETMELNKGTTGLLEKIKDEGQGGESVKKTKKKNKHRVKKSHGVGEIKEDKHGKITKEIDEKLRKKGAEAIPVVKKEKIEATAEGLVRENVLIHDRSSDLASEKPIENKKKLTNGNHAANECKITGVEVKPVTVKHEINPIGSNAERSKTAGGVPEKSASGKNLDLLGDQAQSGLSKSRHDRVVSKDDVSLSYNETSLSEEKIWEQINALRKIVGFQGEAHSSCIEELKALYIFTGVEPPSSFDKSFDLRDAEDKLHFLMSIVGVK